MSTIKGAGRLNDDKNADKHFLINADVAVGRVENLRRDLMEDAPQKKALERETPGYALRPSHTAIVIPAYLHGRRQNRMLERRSYHQFRRSPRSESIARLSIEVICAYALGCCCKHPAGSVIARAYVDIRAHTPPANKRADRQQRKHKTHTQRQAHIGAPHRPRTSTTP